MSNDDSVDEVRRDAQDALKALRGLSRDEDLSKAKDLVEKLRNRRSYELMGQLAEAVSRVDPGDVKNRRLYAQCLIETGRVTAAIDMLKLLEKRLRSDRQLDDPEYAEATGLLGRAYKQIFFDAADKDTDGARNALANAIKAYRGQYERDPRFTWHGVNLIALLNRARSLRLRTVAGIDAESIAKRVVATLQDTPVDKRDEWFLPTLAEASLGLRDWKVIDENIREYVTASKVEAFQVAATLRQFTEVWDLERRDERGSALVDMLRARLLQLPGGEVKLAPDELRRLGKLADLASEELEAVLGPNGARTYDWWKKGIERAASVASIQQRLGTRVGTGFLVRAGDLGHHPAEELLLLTNFHVVNKDGVSPGLRPNDAQVVFEAANPGRVYDVEIVATSPPDRHDASLLRLNPPVTGIEPLAIAKSLPAIEDTARVYIIGHPGGRDLSFSFQDNELLDHEGPPLGKPSIEGVCRLHYRAPTEGGSSGSPVFNANLWEVVALHHKGGRVGMPKLNGKDGTYGANEGISILSIAGAGMQT